MRIEKSLNAFEFRKKSSLGFMGLYLSLKNELNAYKKYKSMIISQLMDPILNFLFIGVALSYNIGYFSYNGNYINYGDYVMMGIIGMLIMSKLYQIIYRATVHKRYGLMALKFQNGIKPYVYIIGMSLYQTFVLILQGLVMYIFALFFGNNINFFNFLISLIAASVFFWFWSSIGVFLTIFFKDYTKRDMVVNVLLTPLSFAAPIFFVLENSPPVIRAVASINPLTYQVVSVRSIAFGEPNSLFIGISTFITILSIVLVSILLSKAKLTFVERS